MEKKDCSLLRPFNEEAAKRGDPVCYLANPDMLIKQYLGGPDKNGAIAYLTKNDEIYTDPASAFLMAPLAWVPVSKDDPTLRPVYKGDVLYYLYVGRLNYGMRVEGYNSRIGSQKETEAEGVVTWVPEGGRWKIGESMWGPWNCFVWTPPKVKREIKLAAFIDDQGELRWVREELFANRGLRVPSDDKVIEVEVPAGQEGGAA